MPTPKPETTRPSLFRAASLDAAIALPEQDFAGEVARIYAPLLHVQEPLGAEFEAIWDANVEILYEP